MTLEDLLAYRGVILNEFERAKEVGSYKIGSLTFQLSSLEESIAEAYIQAGNLDEAAIYYVSQGNSLLELGHIEDGRAAWEKAKSLTTKDVVRNWIDEGLKRYA